ncbi:unnamed protein product [Durusdinium trenchii]|uniref:Uncharacterized protein n=2 Tax=Durusdinium trenchii TaxID=1381693 RepID=A0ABP0QME3_9DINO
MVKLPTCQHPYRTSIPLRIPDETGFMAGAPVHHRLQVLELSSELQTTELRWLMGRMADAEVARSESSLTKSQKNNQKKKLRKEKRRRRPAHRRDGAVVAAGGAG